MPLNYDELRGLGKSGGSQGAVGKLDCGLEQVAVNMLIVLMAPEACSSGDYRTHQSAVIALGLQLLSCSLHLAESATLTFTQHS